MYDKIYLPYNYNELEPFIDSETVNIHYNKHYLGYLNKQNGLLDSINFKYDIKKEELLKNLDTIPIDIRDDVLYNLGDVLNHELYFNSMGKNKINLPIGSLRKKINEQYGSYEIFKEEFISVASKLVGSGYTFLVVLEDGNLDIINLPNQETPLLYNMKPIMALDLWEHAYYLLYRNRRNDYIVNFFEIVDFNNINKNYEKAI